VRACVSGSAAAPTYVGFALPRVAHTNLKELESMKLNHILVGAIAGVACIGLLSSTAGGATSKATTVNVVAGKPSEFHFSLARKTVPHGTVIFRLSNRGTIPHDLKICASPKGGNANSCRGKGTKLIGAARSTTLTYTFKTKGAYEYICTVPGHAAAGMKGDLKVT
jgi:uncharacterized cupredoxin-like copper-binding protein